MSRSHRDRPQHVLVYGATGVQGRPVVERLLAAGHRVRIVTREAARAADLERLGAEVAVGDYSAPESLREATRGIEAVFLAVPFLAAVPNAGEVALRAAEEAGVALVVWNTTGPVPPVPIGNPGADARLEVKQALAGTRLPAITLEPTGYMENFLGPWTAPELAAKDVFAYPLPPSAVVQPVSHLDVAQFAVAALARPELAGATFHVCGPEALDGEGIAARLSEGLGRAIRFRSMSPDEFGAVLDTSFGPGAGAAAVGFYRAAFENPAMISTAIDHGALLAKLPIAPTSLAAWAHAHRAMLSPVHVEGTGRGAAAREGAR